MKFQRLFKFLSIALLIVLVAAACSPQTVEEPDEADAPTAAPAEDEGAQEDDSADEPMEEPTEEPMDEPTEEPAAEEPTEETADDGEMTEFVFAHPGPVRTMDAPVTWYGSTHWLTNLLYDCLIWRTADGSGYVGQAAESWEATDDETWRFHLRPGLTFHNGEPLDAEAVKWNIDRVRTRDDFLVYPQWQFVTEVIVVDDVTVDVKTDGPHAHFEFDISYNGCELLPPDYMAEVGEEEFARNPVGSGPYRLTEFTESDRYLFEAWDDYWGGRPEVDRVVYQVIPEVSSQIAALLAGQVDFVPNVPLPDLERVASAEGIEVMTGPSGRQHMLVARSNSESGAMQETYDGYVVTTESKLIRQAISHALDRELLAEVQGSARPLLLRADEFYPEHTGQWAGQEAAINYYDPELARELIIEAGYDPDGGNRPLLHLDGPAFQVGNEKEVAEVVAALLEEVGFEVEISILDASAHAEQIAEPGNNRELMFDIIGSSPYLTPLFYQCSWEETEDTICPIVQGDWEELGQEILSTVDTEERMALWDDWWDYYVDEALEITLYHIDTNMAMNSEFEWTTRKDGWFTFRDLTLAD